MVMESVRPAIEPATDVPAGGGISVYVPIGLFLKAARARVEDGESPGEALIGLGAELAPQFVAAVPRIPVHGLAAELVEGCIRVLDAIAKGRGLDGFASLASAAESERLGAFDEAIGLCERSAGSAGI